MRFLMLSKSFDNANDFLQVRIWNIWQLFYDVYTYLIKTDDWQWFSPLETAFWFLQRYARLKVQSYEIWEPTMLFICWR